MKRLVIIASVLGLLSQSAHSNEQTGASTFRSDQTFYDAVKAYLKELGIPENSKAPRLGCDLEEYHFDSRTGHCYKFHLTPRTWLRGFMTCVAEGGKLAIINSETEAQVIKDIFAKYPDAVKGVKYVGEDVANIGFHASENGEWLTIEGKPIKDAGYDKWRMNEPNNMTQVENCGSVYRLGGLNDNRCDHPYAFICEKDAKVL